MNDGRTKTVAALVVVISLPSCGLFGDDSSKKNDSVVPVVGGSGGAVPDGAAGAAGGAGGTAGGGATSGGAGGTSTCLGLPGPAMVELASPSGVKYCIDRTEVTQAHYAEFLAKNSSKPGTEHGDCATNASYEPLQKVAENGFEPSGPCVKGKSWTPDTTPNRPVACIDWCDAYAYCAWAGKRLCGKIGGGAIAALPGTVSGPDPKDPANNPNQSQWYNACSQGGKTAYPYGDDFVAGVCEDISTAAVDGGVPKPKLDVASRPGCRGTSAPFSSLFDLSGSLRELTDECFWWSSANGGGYYNCATRGGGFATWSSEMGCATYTTTDRTGAADTVGFRCCRDL